MPSPTSPSIPLPHELELDVHGDIPSGLSGGLVGIDRDGVVRSVQMRGGRVLYRSHRLLTDAAVHHLVPFGHSVLAFGDNSPAYELSARVDALSRVDLAGRGRALAAHPKLDPATGDLHVLARDPDGSQAHVMVTAGGLTRRSRPILDIPSHIEDLALTRNRVALVTYGFVGVVARDGEARTTWIETGVGAPRLVHAHDAGDAVVLLVLTPSLERWTLRPESRSIRREVLDPTPRRFAHCGGPEVDGASRIVWTTGDGTIGHHDLATSTHLHHRLRSHLPGDLVFVPDASTGETDNGWLVGFVHHTSRSTTELRVIDTAAIAGPPIAAIRIPRPVPRELRCAWIPTAPQ